MIVFQFFFFYKLTGGDCKPNFDLEYKYICTNFESVKDNIVWQNSIVGFFCELSCKEKHKKYVFLSHKTFKFQRTFNGFLAREKKGNTMSKKKIAHNCFPHQQVQNFVYLTNFGKSSPHSSVYF